MNNQPQPCSAQHPDLDPTDGIYIHIQIQI
jgi:hypothetical protein